MWRSIRAKFVIVYLLLILFSLELIGTYFVRSLTTSLIKNQTATVQNQTQLMATLVAPQVASGSAHGNNQLTPILTSFPQFLNGNVYVLNQDGVVLETSVGSALVGQKRADSVTTQALLQRRTSVAIHVDPLSNQHLLAVAVPMNYLHHFVGVVEYVVPIQSTYITIRQVTAIFYTISGFVLVLSAVLGTLLTRTVTRPVLDVTGQARKMASGDFTARVAVGSNDEFGDLAVAINDLTDKLEDALAANQREQERLRAIITSMGEGVISLDADFDPLFLNAAASRMMKQIDSWPGGIKAFLGVQGTETNEALNRFVVRELDGQIIHIHLTPIERSSKIGGYVAVLRDVTEQERLNQSRRDFVANVSHELRTPLTSIKSHIEAVRDLRTDEEGTRQAFLGVIEQETDRMVRLTRDLLQLSGLDTQKVQYVEAPISTVLWIHDAVLRFRFQAQQQNILLEATRVDDLLVLGDRDMLDRVLDNLLSNALKYTPSNGKIRIEARRRGREAMILVEDTGIGIPKEDLPHVFERFYRVDKGRSRRLGGSGLGLALAREITLRHDGRIEISSVPDEGTVVRVTLPLAEKEGDA